MSREESPTVSSTLPSSSPFAPVTSQPRSTVSQEAGSDTLATGVPDRPLRLDRLGVRECPEHAGAAVHSFLVEPCEAACGHLGGGAVPEAPRDPEAEARLAAVTGRVGGRQQQRRSLEVVARDELDLGIEVSPVLGERVQLGLPRGRERAARELGLRRGDIAAHELEPGRDPVAVEAREQLVDPAGRVARAAPRGEEGDHLAAPAGVRRGEQRGGAVAVALVLDDEPQACVMPALGEVSLDHLPLVDESHQRDNKLTAVAKVARKSALSEQRLRTFLREMLLIRRFEEKVEERFRAGELPGFLHVAIGQEGVAVGVCQALDDGDVFASTHRADGHTLARGTQPNAVMAELYGKLEGCSHGYGGSMHLYDVERGNLGANAVVGGGLPGITGAALAFQMRGEPRVAVAFFGDGSTNIGMFHEALNLASLWKVPAVFVLENNHWAESTPAKQQIPIDDLEKRAVAFGMHSMKIDGQD